MLSASFIAKCAFVFVVTMLVTLWMLQAFLPVPKIKNVPTTPTSRTELANLRRELGLQRHFGF